MKIELNLPPYTEARIKKNEDGLFIFDVLRRKYVSLTPEEWVRQNFINYLIKFKGYSPTLMNNEVKLSLNGMTRRCDSILYSQNMQPKMIIEYKAPNIRITQKVFDQICRYNMTLKVGYLIISNGMEHFCCRIDYENSSYVFLEDIPNYNEL
ncbi:MAG: type I restriction enzyme HsdR N-terminal domain-containing protein [Bacteroidaceae bacterium]|nr:type I restriction enzyme HsdR N-terminal domain-containing protein [Bacteroidaceae bacterium]